MVKIIAAAFLLGIFIFVLDLVRREKLIFKYALSWMFFCVLGILLTIFDQALFKIAYFFGFELPSNFIFFAFMSVFVLITLLMTVFLCQQDKRNDVIAQKIAMLTQEIDQLKQKDQQKS